MSRILKGTVIAIIIFGLIVNLAPFIKAPEPAAQPLFGIVNGGTAAVNLEIRAEVDGVAFGTTLTFKKQGITYYYWAAIACRLLNQFLHETIRHCFPNHIQ